MSSANNFNPQCAVCQAIQSNAGMAIYEDDIAVAIIDENPAAFGHVAVLPKDHYPIMEQIPDSIIDHIFQLSNKISIVLFETIQIQGTNLVVANGTAAGQTLPHFMINIIPRKDDDSINFTWVPKQHTEEEMSTVELVMKDQAKNIGGFEISPKQEINLDEEHGSHHENEHHDNRHEEEHHSEEHAEHHEEQNKPEEENYMIKQWSRRIG